MTKADFRENKDLVDQWRHELATNGLLQTVLGVMEEENPIRQKPEVTSETSANVEYGRSIGYNEYDRELRALGAVTSPPKFMKARYGVPEPETKK